jgi:hypothetical protein
VNTVWSPSLHKAGIKHLAIVIPLSIYGSFTHSEALGENTISLFTIETFKTVQEAKEWLRERK